MTKQLGICEECKKEYEYEYNPKYPRKYCPECSANKKAQYEATHEIDGAPIPSGTPVFEKPGQAQEAKPGQWSGHEQHTKNGDLSYYVSYAKDIFCAMIEKADKDVVFSDLMGTSTDLVKQAMRELQ